MHDTFPLENFPRRHQYDFTIQPERVMIDIPQIEKKSLLPVGIIPSIHLSPPGQAWRDEMASLLLQAIVGEIFHKERPRAHEAHVTLQYVEEARKFIQASAAHQLPESCESIRIGQELPIGPAGIGHGTEFIQSKWLTAKPRPFLHEQQRPPMDDPRRQCGESDDRKKERKETDGYHQVDDALPREEPRDCRLGGIDDVVHNGITVRDARRATTLYDH